MPECLFVYEDGQVGTRTIAHDYGVWRVPIAQPFSSKAEDFDPSAMVTVTYEEYVKRGKTLNGRSIYCAAPFDVKECGYSLLVSDRESQMGLVDAKIHDELRREYPDAILLDEWIGEPPLAPEERAELKAARVRKRCGRVIVAIRRADA